MGRLSTALSATLIVGFLVTSARGAGVSLTPDCGTSLTHFILAAGGWPTCGGTGCAGGISVYIDDTFVYQGSISGFVVDLREIDVPGICPTCLNPGQHIVKLDGFSECTPNCYKTACLTTTLTIVNNTADPWVEDLTASTDSDGTRNMNIKFDPTGVCDAAPCDELYLVQVVRTTAITGTDTVCISSAQLRLGPDGTEVQRLLDRETAPPTCNMIDEAPRSRDPYRNGRDPRDNGEFGRQGANPKPSTASDAPHLFLQPGADKALLEFEVNVFCGKGKAKGTWMGKTFWIYERAAGNPLGDVLRDPRRGPDRAPPTAEFMLAWNKYLQATGFGAFVPKPSIPPKGGTKCPN